MRVLVDTCIWSRALRSKAHDNNITHVLVDLIADSRAVMMGPIRQELLSGIKNVKDFQNLKNKLTAFDDLRLSKKTFELAAEYFNLCKSKGINGGHIDYLICAAAIEHKCSILTSDKDFQQFNTHIPFQLDFVK